jgi:IS4 transposase
LRSTHHARSEDAGRPNEAKFNIARRSPRRRKIGGVAGVLRLVTNRLDLPAELIAEMDRLRSVIEMFFRTFKQLLGCGHLFSDKHNGVEIQAY